MLERRPPGGGLLGRDPTGISRWARPSSTGRCTCRENGPSTVRDACRKVPKSVEFATKPQPARQLLEGALVAGTPAR